MNRGGSRKGSGRKNLGTKTSTITIHTTTKEELTKCEGKTINSKVENLILLKDKHAKEN